MPWLGERAWPKPISCRLATRRRGMPGLEKDVAKRSWVARVGVEGRLGLQGLAKPFLVREGDGGLPVWARRLAKQFWVAYQGDGGMPLAWQGPGLSTFLSADKASGVCLAWRVCVCVCVFPDRVVQVEHGAD